MVSKFNILKSLFLAFFIAIFFNACSFSMPTFFIPDENIGVKDESIGIQKCQELKKEEKKLDCYDDLSSDNSIASLKLGTYYADKNDYEKAYDYLNSSKEMGNYYANLPLAYLYFEGTGVEKDSNKSLELLKESAPKDPNAAYQLSKFYFNAIGVEQDVQKGLKYLTSAAERNMFLAQKQLAMLYSKGFLTIKKDLVKSKYWLDKANNNKTDKTFDIYKL